jgi:hypothetical protein
VKTSLSRARENFEQETRYPPNDDDLTVHQRVNSDNEFRLQLNRDIRGTKFQMDAQSTTGPRPPAGIDAGLQVTSPESSAILNVPAYLWTNGCGPTAAGMVLGYYDNNGYGNLVSGDAITQTTAVNAMISSSGNYDDYCLPIDSPPDLLPDLSEYPLGDEHPDDSIGDFMKTSQSYHFNYYGWSWFSHMDDALLGYVQYAAPDYYATAENRTFSNLPWDAYKAEIDAGRPVVFLVDTNADGSTDHFVPGVGYNDDGPVNMYACRNTWDTGIHWYEYAAMSDGQPWGIYGVTLFQILADIPVITDTVVINELDPDWDYAEFYNPGDQAVDMTNWQLNDSSGEVVYIFPPFVLQPDAYVVVYEYGDPGDNTSTELYTGGNLDWVSGVGSAALLHDTGVGIDFVRWGTSSDIPPVGTSWGGSNPDGPLYGLVIGRNESSLDTDDGSDWCTQSSSQGSVNVGCGLCYTPGTPVLSSPGNGATTINSRPNFSWLTSTASNEYQIQIDEDSLFATPIISNTLWTQYLPPSYFNDGMYYWRVRGHYTDDGCDTYGIWSDTWHVNIDSTLTGEILLVDDDDNSPDVVSIYTHTLTSLGKTYVIWDTGGTSEPVSNTLNSFDTVVWFTGDAYSGVGYAGEIALGNWLDTGKCLLMSSQDYLYDSGLTPFIDTFLGVDSYTNDVYQDVITGTASIFGDLGPYTLDYFSLENWSDRVSPDLDAGLAFIGDQGDAGVYKDSGDYKTTFLGFPFEAIPSEAGRQDVMAAFLDWCLSSKVYVPLVIR